MVFRKRMNFKGCKVFVAMVLCSSIHRSYGNESDFDYLDHSELIWKTEEFCMQSESFQPRCTKNEAILMRSAIFGRMRIGRCLTIEEMETFGAVYKGDPKNDPRYFGCSVDVVSILDRKCSGKTQCDIREFDISTELKTRPCYPGLSLYLEVSHDCITVADESRSCSLVASNVPTHILASSDSQRKCATDVQPWLIEAPAGQKIKVTLIDFTASQLSQREHERKESCQGVIVDKAAKRNFSVCVGGEQRTKYLYTSSAETLEIYYTVQEDGDNSADGLQFAFKLEAIGCTDLIPPEDAWLKRSDDSIVIGCYSNRQTWQLHCERERWIGVFGNCSHNIVYERTFVDKEVYKTSDWSNSQVLTVIFVCSITLIICLTVLCTGIVCLRKFSTKRKSSQDYKALDFQFNSSMNNRGNETMQPNMLQSAALVNGVHSSCITHQQMVPTYSVFVGDGNFNDNPTNYTNDN